MCSACTSSSPPAVNSAAEQSARSLMFGLNAARRSTAPISSAIAGEPRDQDLQRGRVERAHRRVTGVRTHAPSGPGSATQPSGTHTVQSGSATTAGPTTRRRVGRRELVDGRAAPARRRARPQRDDLDRRARRGEAVAALVLGREVVDGRAHRELVALARVAAVERTSRPRRRAPPTAARPPRRRARSSASSRPVVVAGRRPRAHELASARRATRARPPRTRRRAAARSPPRIPSASATAHAWSGPAPRTRRARARAGRRPARRSRPAPPAPSPRRPPRPRPSAVDPGALERGARRRRRRGARAREARCRRGCGRARGRRRSPSARSPPRP